jgi:hypothetical protein
MHKRLEIVVRNPGFEQTDHALGALTLDFEDQAALDVAITTLYQRLEIARSNLRGTIILENEKREQRGFNPEYYVSHHIADADDWERPNWMLPSEGEDAPPREN